MTASRKWLSFVMVSFFISTLAAQQEKDWRHGIVRVNTDVSAGVTNFRDTAQLAKNADIDFVVFSDQFLVKAEYGFLPLKNVLKFSRSRPSIVTFGIDKYLEQIKQADREFPDMILIPGADIAPHYFWTGNPFSANFATNQFSEQLTIFGPTDPELYRGLPVIHNEKQVFNFDSIIKLLPFLLVIWGVVLVIRRKKGGYSDQQGNVYEHSATKKRIAAGIVMIAVGLIWTLGNSPFTQPLGFDQYRDYGEIPYQQVIDYIRQNAKEDECVVFWSAPEAKMEDRVFGVKLVSLPYLEDILRTFGHNGFAGIYGDALTAHKPGHEWDKLLLEYCQGKRRFRPVIIGELDYHGNDRKIDLIQTVVAVDKFDTDNILEAIRLGRSYAYANVGQNKLIIENINLMAGKATAGLGETLEVADNQGVVLNVKGRIEGLTRTKSISSLSVVVDGKMVNFRKVSGENFDIKVPLKVFGKSRDKHYVRFVLETSQAGFIFSNPIFFKTSDQPMP